MIMRFYPYQKFMPNVYFVVKKISFVCICTWLGWNFLLDIFFLLRGDTTEGVPDPPSLFELRGVNSASGPARRSFSEGGRESRGRTPRGLNCTLGSNFYLRYGLTPFDNGNF